MKTLLQCYNEISENTKSWSYYESYPLPLKGAWENYSEAYNYIKQYFDFAGKGNIFNDPVLKEHKSSIKRRAPHIISTYLLGIKLAECFSLDIATCDECNMDFKYYWFLACLYHDAGYALEDHPNCHDLFNIKSNGIEGFYQRYKLEYTSNRVFQTYPREIVDLYLKCRADHQMSKPVIDHGIAGGLLLYDKLLKNYQKAFFRRNRSSDTKDDYYVKHSNGRVLHFSKSHHDAYAKAADAIIMHNIWETTLREYIEKSSYSDRVPEENLNKRISIENKLCFILCLSDTLEPIKRVTNTYPWSNRTDLKYLNQISIATLNNDRGFKLQMPKSTYKVFKDAISNLDSWIVINVEKPIPLLDYVTIRITV